MPIDPKDRDAARARLREVTDEAAVRTHPGYERSDDEPSPHGGDSAPYRTRQQTLGDRLEPHGRAASHIQKILALIITTTTLVGGIVTGTVSLFNWAVDKNVAAKFTEERKYVAAEIASATAPQVELAQRLRARERRDNKDDQRWDRLDRYIAQQKRAGAVAPPKFGPTAEKRGELTKYDEPEEE